MRSITVIGSGNAFHTDGRGHSCFLLETSAGRRLLLDAGATALCRLQEFDVPTEGIDTILMTHFHGDHVLGLPFLVLHMNFVKGRTHPLTLAGPPGIGRVCREVLDLAYPEIEIGFDLRFVEIGSEPVEIEGCVVEPFPMQHRPESLGYRLTGPAGRAAAFSGDCRFDDALVRLVDGVDLAMVELSLRERNPEVSHVSLDDIREGRRRFRTRRLVFTHLDDAIARQVVDEDLGEASFDGMVIEL